MEQELQRSSEQVSWDLYLWSFPWYIYSTIYICRPLYDLSLDFLLMELIYFSSSAYSDGENSDNIS